MSPTELNNGEYEEYKEHTATEPTHRYLECVPER